MKNSFFALILFISAITHAQVSKVYLQASGLTCSMCSNAINKSLKTLDFVRTISADVKNYTFELSFEPDSPVDFEKIRRKVEDAGFSVSGFYATVYFDNVVLSGDRPVIVGNSSLLFIDTKSRKLDGEFKVRIVDKGFIAPKEFKKYGYGILPGQEGLYHVTL